MHGNFRGSAYRIADTANEDSCTAIKNRIYPKVGKNINNQTRFIVQKAKFNIKQAVTTNICVRAGKKCQIVDDEHLHSSRCEQRSGHLTLHVFVKNEVIEDDFYLPSCCVCTNDKKSVFLR